MPAPAPLTDAERLEAVRSRDPRADGRFVYSVSTTGVFCHPSCGSRVARPEHVQLHDSAADALAAGFRPCRRCRPDLPPRAAREVEAMARACRIIEDHPQVPTTAELASAMGMSRHHFHRVFSRVVGVTPRAYADAQRHDRLRAALDAGTDVTTAIYEAGYGSSSRFYAAAPAMLAMTPTAFRSRGEHEEIWHQSTVCTLGHLLIAGTSRGICMVAMDDDPDALVTELRHRFRRATFVDAPPQVGAWVDTVVRLVEGPGQEADGRAPTRPPLPLDIRGTAFQRRVWEALSSIPVGDTATYGELAARIGRPGAARAVARACASNPVAVVVPCHRVVGADGTLTGYRWGLDRKRALLRREADRRPDGPTPSDPA